MISYSQGRTRGAAPKAYLVGYAALVGGTVVAFIGVSSYGERTLTSAPLTVGSGTAPATAGAPDALIHVLVGLAAIVLTCRVTGWLLAKVGQPAVIGEMVGGILLGPTVLGHVAPDLMRLLFAPAGLPFVYVIAQLGVILYMFLVGLELDAGMLRRRLHTAVATSHASIAVPFTLGAIAALYLFPEMSTPAVPFTAFALFVSIAMSITAFPVLARILAARRMSQQELGTLALACAAGDDVTAWCLLALLIGVASATMGSAAVVLASTVVFIAVMTLLVQPIVRRWSVRGAPAAPNALPVVLVGVLISALTTEAIGIHAMFGAFLCGYIIPHDSRVASALKRDLWGIVTMLMLPPFFAFTGMRTEISLGSGAEYWLTCLALVLVATVGKVGGAMVSARLTGLSWRNAAGLGVLMNTRGLMELIVLNIGLDRGIITPTFFSMMVLMAIVTTLMTVPGLSLLKLGTSAPAEATVARAWSDAGALAPAVSATNSSVCRPGGGANGTRGQL